MLANEYAVEHIKTVYRLIDKVLHRHEADGQRPPGFVMHVQQECNLAIGYISQIPRDFQIAQVFRELHTAMLALESLLKQGSDAEVQQLGEQLDLTIQVLQKLHGALREDDAFSHKYQNILARIELLTKDLSSLLIILNASPRDIQVYLSLHNYDRISRLFTSKNGGNVESQLRSLCDVLQISSSIPVTFLQLSKETKLEKLKPFYYGLALYQGAIEALRTKSTKSLPQDPNYLHEYGKIVKADMPYYQAVVIEGNKKDFPGRSKLFARYTSEIISSMSRIRMTLSTYIEPPATELLHMYKVIRIASSTFKVKERHKEVAAMSRQQLQSISENIPNTTKDGSFESMLRGLRTTISQLQS